MRKLAAALCVLALSGCTTVTVLEANKGPEERVGSVPSIGTASEASVGNPIFSQFRYWSRTGYRMKDAFSTRVGLSKVVVAEGDFLYKASIEGQVLFCTEKASFIDPLAGPLTTACFVDANSDGTFTRVKAKPALVWFEDAIPKPLRYERSELVTPKADSFKYEILYQGTSKGTLRLSYREYINDMARPSFFQEVSYDIAAYPAEIAFKSVRIEVLNTDNTGIRYRILSSFQ